MCFTKSRHQDILLLITSHLEGETANVIRTFGATGLLGRLGRAGSRTKMGVSALEMDSAASTCAKQEVQLRGMGKMKGEEKRKEKGTRKDKGKRKRKEKGKEKGKK